jgi:serine/threonine-protein kinase
MSHRQFLVRQGSTGPRIDGLEKDLAGLRRCSGLFLQETLGFAGTRGGEEWQQGEDLAGSHGSSGRDSCRKSPHNRRPLHPEGQVPLLLTTFPSGGYDNPYPQNKRLQVSDRDEPEKKSPPPTIQWDREEEGSSSEGEAPSPTIQWDRDELSDSTPEESLPGGESQEEDPLIGTLIRDKWEVLQRLGAGSFGTVYKVRDVKGGWIEALKILGVDRITGSEADTVRKRFLREAQIMKRLGTQSAHIVGLSTYEEDLEGGLIYFLMEFVEGKSLGQILEEDGPFAPERAVELALQVCDALMVAHEGEDGVVHRDLKLENIMLTRDRSGQEVAKVLDFGIAKLAEKDADSRLTTAGTLGTPGFAAPEQLRAEEVDARTDLFAFGVILYCLLTGQDPWFGKSAWEGTTQVYELMVANERAEMRPMSETGAQVPPALVQVVERLLRRDPAERFQSAMELKGVLEGIAAGDMAGPSRVAEKAGAGVAPGRRRAALVLVAALALLLVGAGLVRPWGRTLTLEAFRGQAAGGSVLSVWLTQEGFRGRMAVLGLPAPFHVPLAGEDATDVVRSLRDAGLEVDTSPEVARLVRAAMDAQRRMAYFGAPGSDVMSFAQEALSLEPGNPQARSLLLKVAERMAWDAEAALADGSPERAQQLASECLALSPDHPGCQGIGVGGS